MKIIPRDLAFFENKSVCEEPFELSFSLEITQIMLIQVSGNFCKNNKEKIIQIFIDWIYVKVKCAFRTFKSVKSKLLCPKI